MTTPKIDPNFPNRPQHPDFWDMVSAVTTLDEAGDAGTPIEQISARYGIDFDSLVYMANQRALRAEKLFVNSPAPMQAKYSANFIDGFMAGVLVGQRKAVTQVLNEGDDGNRRQGPTS